MEFVEAQDTFEQYRCRHLPQLEMMRASCMTYEFPRHFHFTYVIELVEEGVDEFYCGDRMLRAGPGQLIIIHPEEVHTGAPGGGTRLRYSSMYPDLKTMSLFGEPPRFESSVINDPDLTDRFRAAHSALSLGDERLMGESLLVSFLTLLVRRHSSSRVPSGVDDAAPLRPALDLVARSYHTDIGLSDLADAAGYSPFHFLRMFQKSTGMTPHRYVTNLRVEKARTLLREGMAAAEVAAELGFADQSHFVRTFKKYSGTTPSRFALG